MSKIFSCVFFLCLSASLATEGSLKALERLAMTTDMLIVIGEEMIGEPQSGVLILNDTLSIDISLSTAFTYQFIVWTDSAFNYIDFWLTNPHGAVPIGDYGDHTTLVVMPDSTETGIWQIEMQLLEGAYSDTAYYAMAIFQSERFTN